MRVVEVVCMASFAVYLLAFVLFVAGFAAPYWYEMDSTGKPRTGLWRSCEDNGDKCDSVDLDKARGWFKATVALEICGFIFALVAGFAAIFLPVTSGLQIMAGLLVIFGVAAFSAEVNDEEEKSNVDIDLLWGFGLVCFAGVLFLLNGIVLGVYSGYLGCYMERVIPCAAGCCDGGFGWFGQNNYGYPGYGERPYAGFANPPRRPSVYVSNTQPRLTYPGIAAPSVGGYPTYPMPVGKYGNVGGRYPRPGYSRGYP